MIRLIAHVQDARCFMHGEGQGAETVRGRDIVRRRQRNRGMVFTRLKIKHLNAVVAPVGHKDALPVHGDARGVGAAPRVRAGVGLGVVPGLKCKGRWG